MASTVDIGTLIVETPGICGGRPRIDGSRITVRHVIDLLQSGLSPEVIADEYPQLTLAQVYAAITYYHANQQQLDRDFQVEKELEERLEDEWLAQNAKS